MRSRIGVVALLLVAVGVALGSNAAAQDVALATRGPRFLAKLAPNAAPEPIDVRRVAVLREQIALDLDGATLKEALLEITRQTGLAFAYTYDVVDPRARVHLKAERITVAAAVTEVLLDAGVDVLLSSARQAALVRRADRLALPTGAIVGRIVDAKTRTAVAAAEVFLDKTRWRATTDTAGRYRLSDVDTGAYTLTVRRLGYTKQSRQVAVREGTTDTVDFVLTPAATRLDELVATATGQQRRRDLGNAITTIKADSVLRSAPIRSLTDLLQGRVPGMSLQHTSGAPGDPARIRLRGLSSVMRGNDPVVIVDGIRVYAAQSEARSGNLTNLGSDATLVTNNPAPSPLDQIDPNIIEKIEVFKGPSAATLYGADAANGVIVITTKRGKPGPTRWDLSLQRGRTTPAGPYPDGYYRFGHAPVNGTLFEFCPLTYLRCKADSVVRYQALNDPDLTILDTGHRSALSLTASGGSQTMTYSVTGTYGDEIGLLKLPAFEVERFQTKFNREPPDWMQRPHQFKTWSVTSTVTALLGRSAQVSLAAGLSRSDQQRTQLEGQQARLAATYVDKVTGVYYGPGFAGANFPGANPFTLLKQDYVFDNYDQRTRASTITFTTGLNATWAPRPWLNAAGNAGLNVIPRDDETFRPTGLRSPSDGGALIRGTGRSLVSTLGLQGTARQPLKWGFTFETSVGANLVTTNTNDLVSSAGGLVPGTSSLSGATSFQATDARASTSSFGWYLEPRLTGQRLSLSTGLRLDGGSAYGVRLTRTGGGLFGGLLGLPKLNGSWVISEEPWFPLKAVFSSLRLRGAYGQAQVQPGPADRLRLYTRRVDGSGDLLDLNQLGNTDLRPERSTEFEGGFDADVLDSRLSVELTGYRKLQVDALMPVTLPNSVNGGGTIVKNIGNIRNSGVELTTTLVPVRSALLTWKADVTVSRNTNTLTKLGPGVTPNPRQGFVAGYPVGGRWARAIRGYADANGDGVIQQGEVQLGDSLVFMGRLLPAYQSAIHTDVTLFGGAIGVSAAFSYDAGATQINQPARSDWVVSRALADPTTPLDQQAAVAVIDSTDYGITQTVSTFRFTSLSVNYRAPSRVTRLLGARELTVAVQGANLGLHSTYQGKDPDVSAWSPTEQIVDAGQLAQPRTWQLALFLKY